MHVRINEIIHAQLCTERQAALSYDPTSRRVFIDTPAEDMHGAPIIIRHDIVPAYSAPIGPPIVPRSRNHSRARRIAPNVTMDANTRQILEGEWS